MNQFVKFLLGIIPLLCVMTALLGFVFGQIPAPGTAVRKRADREAAQNCEGRKVQAPRRRLLADVQAHRRNVARSGSTATAQ